MPFNSLTFAAFFAVGLALHNAPLPWRVDARESNTSVFIGSSRTLFDMLVGSIFAEVIRRSNIPVLVVPARGS